MIAENAAGIAKIIINTAAANSAVALKYTAIPGGAILAAGEIARNRISAGIGIASAVAATAKGLAALGGGSAGGGSVPGGGGGGSSTSTQQAQPNYEFFGGNNNANNLTSAQDVEQTMTVVAVVSETEITSTQNKIKKITDNASL